MKKLMIIVVIVAVLIVAGIFFLFSNLNSLIAGAIEKNGGDVTQTSVSVSGVDVSIREGRGSIKGLAVASPEGFDARRAFSLDDITIDIDVKSLREDPIVIDEIRIQAPVVFAEITKTGSSNIDELRKQVREYSAGKSVDGGGQSGTAKRIRIKQFVFEQGKIEVDASALGIEKHTIVLPGIRLENVGGSGGALPDEIAKIIVTTVIGKAVSEVASSETNRLIEEKLGGSIKDKAKGLLEKIGG
ncbi:MAG: AsmA family protein [Candidatus Krumholzibacteria bacterium]|jgi:hypothetical protein|nr:AsmA family protein [Candidatus Krumholzibacteria bacterium]